VTYRSGAAGAFQFPEIMGGGVAFFDADGDGDQDLYLIQGGAIVPPIQGAHPNRFFRNRGDGTFQDVTAAAGLGDVRYGMGVAVGDVDRDGDLDLFVANLGRDVLYVNAGDGTFVDGTVAAGVGGDADDWSASAALVDYDDDGALDLFVVRYLDWSSDAELACTGPNGDRDYCGPLSFDTPTPDTLYRNRGDGTFEDVTAAAGLDTATGNGLGLVAADFNGDHRLDFYIANDGTPNRLWLQDPTGVFTDAAPALGCAVNAEGLSEAGMGVVAVDVENDGDLDLFLSHLAGETNTLYRADDGRFVDASSGTGLDRASILATGFGIGAADFDHDGHIDLYVANGRVRLPPSLVRAAGADPYAEADQLVRNDGEGQFSVVVPPGGMRPVPITTSRGLALADYDGDGDVDIAIVDRDTRLRLLRNDRAATGRWIAFTVRDRRGHEALGAMVTLETSHGQQHRLVHRTAGYLASHDPRVHFGLPEEATIEDVRVRWRDGVQESFGARAPGERHEIQRAGR
ncbi:MAG: CRTAC1 family protein, partial [Phycisphaerales bacterium]|nr:CRTAC1 family protein [Phycisphaerales bacterium]